MSSSLYETLLITNPRNRIQMIGPADFYSLDPWSSPMIKAPSEEKPEAYETYMKYGDRDHYLEKGTE